MKTTKNKMDRMKDERCGLPAFSQNHVPFAVAS